MSRKAARCCVNLHSPMTLKLHANYIYRLTHIAHDTQRSRATFRDSNWNSKNRQWSISGEETARQIANEKNIYIPLILMIFVCVPL